MAFVGTVAFLAFMVLTLSIRQVVMANVDSADVEAMLGFVFASMVAGWLGGGPQRETRQVLASASSMRNVGLCLAIVTRSLPDSGIEIPLVAFCALMIPPNLVLTILMLVLNRFRSRT
jgi:BASS family bile acid:Na+ symporter